MAEIERMTVVFPEAMAVRLREAVATGDYATTSEAVRDAVRLWSDQRAHRDLELTMLRRAWDEGKASGVAGPWDMAEILTEADRLTPADDGTRG
jgi:antitoxin ParD1/3/4